MPSNRTVARGIAALAAAAAVCLSLAACGYHLRESSQPIGAELTSLAIPLMESSSSTIGFEAEFTTIVRDEFIRYSQVPLVPRERAAAVLIGRIHEIRTEPYSYALNKTEVQGASRNYPVTRSRWLYVTMDAKLVESATGKTLWEVNGMEDKATYPVGTDPLANRAYERSAIEEIARRLAERMFQATMERF
ncbi:LPS assembly lipoprotein LptE [Desulfatiglans anilini]|uniref:LPS assembly lipoprotein LptE n=1 Tax=Desulfatiglans anilini TaxID=90728 RepID=UPI0004251BE8|nr:LPS assembly lipoprotein LptE [Desulfatiglans anilini]